MMRKTSARRWTTIGRLILAEACQERGAHLTHLASGCVFYGPSPDPKGWREDDHANPSATYSRSKYAADLLLSTLPNVAIVDDLIEVVKQVMEKRGVGVFHATNPGTMRHRDLIRLYDELVDLSHTNEWISNDDLVTLGLATKGRSNCILQSTRLQALGVTMRPIEIALRDCMEKYAAAVRAAETVKVS